MLDEPTSDLDDGLERSLIEVLSNEFRSDDTAFVITHRLPIFALTERLIVLSSTEGMLDGPLDQVLAQFEGQRVEVGGHPQLVKPVIQPLSGN